MIQSDLNSELELRVSARPVIAVFGIAAVFLSQFVPPAWESLRDLSLLTLVVSAVGFVLDSWKPGIGRLYLVGELGLIVVLMSSWVGLPGSLALMAIPTALAAALMGLGASILTAAGITALLLWSSTRVAASISPTEIGVALAATWVMVGVMYLVHKPVREIVRWAWDRYQRAQDLLDEARDRQMELRQASEDLVDANLQLTRLNLLTQRLRQAAEDARRAKQRFVANVSHELRTPLNMIIGFSEMLVEGESVYPGPMPAALSADLEVILRNARHLSSLVDDVLDLSQIEAERMSLVRERIDVQRIIEDAVSAIRPLFESKGLYLQIQVPQRLPPVLCDPTRIREVILNLLSNAGRFTGEGGVNVRARQEGNDLVISVADTGPGIADQDQTRIFRSFEQLDASIGRRQGGTGLGLSISKSFVELHGGEMWVESKEGQGATFSFRLPIDPPIPDDRDALRWLTPSWEFHERTRRSTLEPTAPGPRIVVLESGHTLQRLLVRYLDGAEIVPVTGLEEALQELRQVPSQALFVNDSSMGEAIQHLATMDLPNGTSAIACSIPDAHASTDSLGASEYLIKPVLRDDLLGTLDQLGLAGKTILIVDDEPEALQLFWRMLASSEGEYRVLLASGGREGLDILREQRPDAVLLDLIMPDMDGFQFLAAKRTDPALRDILVVVISARDPVGHPIVANTVAIAQKGGLSIPQLLSLTETVTGSLSVRDRPADPVADPASTGAPLG